ncbi:MAG: mechanosensitive ion channel [Acidobacteriota bacterium]|jgi:small-conductance mechanosensitive channel
MMEWLRSIDIQSFLNSGLDVGAAHVTVLSVLTGLTVVLFTLWLSRVLENAAERGLGLTKVVDPTSVAVTGRIVHYAVLVIGFGVAIHMVGFDLTGLFAAGAVMAVAIGFAAQNVLQNFFSGIILLSEGAIKPGDVLEVEGQVVRVTRMGIRSTVVRTRDEEEVILPNTLLAQSSVKNYTMQDSLFRLRTRVGVTYGSDMKLVKETLLAAAVSLPDRYEDHAPVALMAEFGDSSVIFDVSVWVDDPWATLASRSALNERIWWALKEAGITIAFPQMDVHLDESVVGRLGAGASRD